MTKDLNKFLREHLTSPYHAPRPGTTTGLHEGIDISLGTGAQIPALEDCVVIWSGKSWGYRYRGNQLVRTPDYGVITESKRFYIIYWHVQANSYPRAGAEVSRGEIICRQTDHVHIGVFTRRGPWRSVTAVERAGWAIDPLSVTWGKVDKKVDILKDVFPVAFITQAQRWPTEAEKEAFRRSKYYPAQSYTWVQENAPNPVRDELQKQIEDLTQGLKEQLLRSDQMRLELTKLRNSIQTSSKEKMRLLDTLERLKKENESLAHSLQEKNNALRAIQQKSLKLEAANRVFEDRIRDLERVLEGQRQRIHALEQRQAEKLPLKQLFNIFAKRLVIEIQKRRR